MITVTGFKTKCTGSFVYYCITEHFCSKLLIFLIEKQTKKKAVNVTTNQVFF